MASAVELRLNKRFWPEVMNSASMAAALQGEAERIAAASDAECGAPGRASNLRNPNFVARTAVRRGTASPYLIGLVIAANPRSMWKSRHDGVLHG